MTLLKKLIATAAIAVPLAFSGASAQMNPIKFERDSLPNGLQIVYSIDKSAPIVATVVHYHVGSKDEETDKTGYAHFFEHLMFEATADIPRATIDKYVLNAGGNLNAYTSFDETVYFFQLPSEQLNLALWIESERMRKLLVDTAGVETQRGVVLEELKMRTTNQPYGSFGQKRMEYLFPGTHYAWAVIGSPEHIQKAKISDFRGFYNKYYSPANATLVICGDFDIAEAKKLVRAYFGIHPKAEAPERFNFSPKPVEKPVRETIEDPRAKVPSIYISYQGPSMKSADYYAMSLLTDIMSSGESSRLTKRLVDKERIASVAGISPLFLEGAGALTFIARPIGNASMDKIEKILLEEIQNIVKNGVSDEELEKAKNITETEYISAKKNVLDKAKTLAKYSTYWHNPELVNNELKQYMAVTKEQIKEVAAKYLSTENRVTLIYMPKSK